MVVLHEKIRRHRTGRADWVFSVWRQLLNPTIHMILCWLFFSLLPEQIFYIKITDICFSLHSDFMWCFCVSHWPPHLFLAHFCFSSLLSKQKRCGLFTQPADFYIFFIISFYINTQVVCVKAAMLFTMEGSSLFLLLPLLLFKSPGKKKKKRCCYSAVYRWLTLKNPKCFVSL